MPTAAQTVERTAAPPRRGDKGPATASRALSRCVADPEAFLSVWGVRPLLATAAELPRPFDDLFDLTKRTDFEGVLFPILARERKLYSALIPTESWFQVNDPKSLNALIDVVREEAESTASLLTNA